MMSCTSIARTTADRHGVARRRRDADVPGHCHPTGGVKKGDPEEPETIPIPYSFDQVLELISAPRRRSLLYHLKDRSDTEVPRTTSSTAKLEGDSWR